MKGKNVNKNAKQINTNIKCMQRHTNIKSHDANKSEFRIPFSIFNKQLCLDAMVTDFYVDNIFVSRFH